MPLQENRAPSLKIRSISLAFRTRRRFGKLRSNCSPWIPGSVFSVFLLLIGNRELDSSFCSPSFQNKSAAFCLHSGTETEFSIPFNSARLIGAFHDSISLSQTAALAPKFLALQPENCTVRRWSIDRNSILGQLPLVRLVLTLARCIRKKISSRGSGSGVFISGPD